MIHIVDYGMGNLRSVQKALESLKVEACFTSDPREVADATSLVLPGVGAFRDAMHALERFELVEPIREHVHAGKRFLGICLGLQLLFDVSYEDGEWPGLGLIAGSVERIERTGDEKIPHMGWNSLDVQKECPLLNGLPADSYFYFVHSYHVVPTDESVVVAKTNHGQPLVAMVSDGTLFASQFHPEKSQRLGLRMLQNFTELCAPVTP